MRMRGVLPALLLFLAMFPLGGCYETTVMVLSAEEAEPVPGLEGTYLPRFNHFSGPQDKPDSERLTLKRSGAGNDYSATSEAEEVGTLRFHKLKDDVYLAQVDSGPLPLDPQSYDVGFVRVTGRELVFLMPVPPGVPLPKDPLPRETAATAFTRWLDPSMTERLHTESEKIAATFKVTLSDREGGSLLDGGKAAVSKFLLSHRTWSFVPFAGYVREK